MCKNVNREGMTYGEFRAAALAFCSDPNERVGFERAIRRGWQAGEDPTDYAQMISKDLAQRARRARLDPEGTARPLSRIQVKLAQGECYHGGPHASAVGEYVNGEERIPLR